jgi:hexosaminidase
MKNKLLFVLAGFAGIVGAALPLSAELSLIPLPAEVETADGFLEISGKTTISATGEARAEAEHLAAALRAPTGFPLPVVETGGTIRLIIDPALETTEGREGYRMEISPSGASLTAAAPVGLFHAAQTFRQLLPPEAFSPQRVSGVQWRVPAVKIADRPRFGWRGFMIDTSRHFIPMPDLKRLVDMMAAHKLNLLHLHLTDDDGWRIEIKAYPKLTEIGAWRGTKCKLPNTRKGEEFERYGGFYTQEELRGLVAYAKARHISIMPEIDLPGHSLAITTAYPETLPTKMPGSVSAQGHKANAISPAREENYRMIETIMAEVAAIFPFRYVHVGGDEVNRSLWSECPEIKKWMATNKIPNLHGAQVEFTRRLGEILARHDRRLAGWQEIASDKLSKDTLVMAWIGPGAGWNAAKRGFPAVMAPGGHCYFDMPYPNAHDEPPSHWWAGPVGIDRTYAFDPLAGAKLDDAARARVLGVHAALWTEFVKPWKSKSGWLELPSVGDCANYKIWPRLCALAEMGWTPQKRRNITSFRDRLGPAHFRRLAAAGTRFRLEPPHAEVEKRAIRILPPYRGGVVRFTTDGTDPFDSKSARTWDGREAPNARLRRQFRMRTVLGDVVSPLASGAVVPPIARWSTKGWKPGESRTLEFALGAAIDSPGVYSVQFRKRKGPGKIALGRVEIVADGKSRIVAEPGKATTRAVLAIRDWKAAQSVMLRATLRVDGDKPLAEGDLLVEMVAAAPPTPMKVVTKIGHYTDHDPGALLDADPDTYFWSNRNLKAGDTLTWVFDKPLAIKHLEVRTGMPNKTRDQLLDGVVEVSENGRDFKKVSGFAYGTAKAALDGRSIRAVRLRATGKSAGWVVVQDLVIKRAGQ